MIAFCLFFLTLIKWTEYTIPFYDIVRIANYKKQILDVFEDNILNWRTLYIAGRNILRWGLEISLSYCILAAGFAIKKRWGMGNPKDFS